MKGWGKILLGTRLEKQVPSQFFQAWTAILIRGIPTGEGVLSIRGKVAHMAANDLVRAFLGTECDSLLFLDSDALVEPDIVDQFHNYEEGWAYDVLQAFYVQRGWPPIPIWMRKNALGQMTEVLITQDDHVEDVDGIGLHCTIVRREVFERLLGDEDPQRHEWFSYPRGQGIGEDIAFAIEAQAAGFRIGATTAIKAGHLSEVPTTWETYQDWMRVTGRNSLVERYRSLAALVAQYTSSALGAGTSSALGAGTSQSAEMVVARSMEGNRNVRQAWERYHPETPDEVRAFYGATDNGYLYDLVQWNCQPLYQRIIAPLSEMRDRWALVIGAGLGTEVETLAETGNAVDVYELPGVLRDFLTWRFVTRLAGAGAQEEKLAGKVEILDGWPIYGHYQVVVAVDVLEHVHPDEIDRLLLDIDQALEVGGLLLLHVTWGGGEAWPQHYDHHAAVEAWLAEGYEQIGEFLWRKRGWE